MKFRTIKKLEICFAILLVNCMSYSYAGVGWYITIVNNTSHQIIATPDGGGGSKCWYLNDLNSPAKSIQPNSSATLYTEEDNNYFHGWKGCSASGMFSSNSYKYVEFVLNNTSITLASSYNTNAAKAYRSIENSNTGSIQERDGEHYSMNASRDTVKATIYVNSDNPVDIVPTNIEW